MEDRFKEVLEGDAGPLDVAVLADDIADLDYPYVIKSDGKHAEDPAAYILANYGEALSWRRAEVHPDGDYIFRLVGFYELAGDASMYCYCIDRETQEPVSGKASIRSWPGAPALGGEILPPASDWTDTGIICYVGVDGRAHWNIGLGEAYYPESGSGVCQVFVCSLDGPSDLVEHWGYLKGTNYRHLAPILERVAVNGDNGNGNGNGNGGDGDLDEVVEQLERIADGMEWFQRP